MSGPASIYLNHAGTSWPKPIPVQRAVEAAMASSPESWAASFEAQHRAVAAAFGVDEPERLLLTPGCTSALAVGIADQPWAPGDRVVTSAWEHHALLRPVLALTERGVEHVIVPPGEGGALFDLETFSSILAEGRVRLVAVSAASNVTGALLPIDAIAALAHEHGASVLVDAAQVAGWMPIDFDRMGVEILAFAGHKGPQAPWGVGGLCMAPGAVFRSPRVDAEGRSWASEPGYCDTGSVDRLALAGLVAGLQWLAQAGPLDRLGRARAIIDALAAGLARHPELEPLGPGAADARVPTLALRCRGRASRAWARALAERGVIVSAGLQCAALAHRTLGTLPTGVLRLSVGPQTSAAIVDPVLAAVCAVG